MTGVVRDARRPARHWRDDHSAVASHTPNHSGVRSSRRTVDDRCPCHTVEEGRMRLRHTVLFLVPLLVGPTALLAQGRVIRGVVVDSSTGAPITAANIAVRGTTIGASTGSDGRFTITNVPDGEVPLIVRRIGYRARELRVRADEGEIRVAMTSDPLQL